MRTINTKRTVIGQYKEIEAEVKSVIDFSRTHQGVNLVAELAMSVIDKCEAFADAHKGTHAYFTMKALDFIDTITDEVLVEA